MIRLLWALLAAMGVLISPLPAKEFTEEVWEQNQDIYQAILEHPFLKGMEDGSLPKEAFVFYLLQDAFYLGKFAQALEATAARAPQEVWKLLLLQHARESVQAELTLHESVFKDHGISSKQQQEIEPAPEAFAYTSFLIATAYSRPFEESMAALLPCYWIYWEVGKELQRKGSRDPDYQKWIDTYASEGYGETVKAVMEIVNESARKADSKTIERMKEHFRRASRYEWMFWDSAYGRRQWPPRLNETLPKEQPWTLKAPCESFPPS